ncbi:MAG: 2-phospho-L-lactate guanylyltransferase [Acetobacteraceae bacterium]
MSLAGGGGPGVRVADVWAALPVKGFAGAKQRLGPALTAAQRRALAAAMLEDVLEALGAASLAGILVNTEDPEAAALARARGAEVMAEDAAIGHTGAVAAMARRLAAAGRSAMLVLPGDIPRITAAEIAALCAAAGPRPSFTIAPARDERGSNAVLLAPPGAVSLRFGDDSFFPHLDAARRAGIEPRVVALPGVGLDIDTPDDLLVLRQAAVDRPGRTGRLLASFDR